MNILKLNTVPLDDKVIIKKGGEHSGDARLQSKEVKIEKSGITTVRPDIGYDGLEKVSIKATFQKKDVEITLPNTTTIKPDAPYCALGKVSVTPILQEKTIYKINVDESFSIMADDGNVGLSKVNIVKKQISDYLTIEALEDGLQVSLSINDLEYCIDGNDKWTLLPQGVKTPSINAGQMLSFRASGLQVKTTLGIGTFSINQKCNVLGNIMSLIGGDDDTDTFIYEDQFHSLFLDCTTIISCENLLLPATRLNHYCYANMFSGCTSLIKAPKLPATTLYDYCYEYMFSRCASLVEAPELPATDLSQGCYRGMFFGCTSLVNAPILPATTLWKNCYANMFDSCTSLSNAPELPATTIVPYCYYRMFQNCTSLINAPVLPTIYIGQECYSYMFKGCSKLNYVKAMFITYQHSDSTKEWLSGVSPTGTFVKNRRAEWNTIGIDGVPEGWTVEYVYA